MPKHKFMCRMGNPDKNQIEQLVKTRKKAHAYYSIKSPVYLSFADMEQHTYKIGTLSKKKGTDRHCHIPGHQL